jgi:hypothetical protein
MQEREYRRISTCKLLLSFVLGALLLGCGSPQVPTPRHAIVPVAVTNLSAHQADDTVVLNFMLPTISTDQQPLSEMPSVYIYRDVAGQAAASNRGKKRSAKGQLIDSIPADALSQYQKNGQIEFLDKLEPNELLSSTGTQISYSVRTSISTGKESAGSNSAVLRVYPPPSSVRDLRVTLTETALVLDWNAPQAVNAQAQHYEFMIYRAEVDPATSEAAVLDPSKAKLVGSPALLAQTTETEYRDTSYQFGSTYFYTIRASVQIGTEKVESADAAPVVLTARDIFPPVVPEGLEAITIPEVNGRPASIELTWSINTEPDLAGYNIYRSEEPGVAGLKLNMELLSAPTFHDMSIVPGNTYFYRVGAVDKAGNESALSSAVEVKLPGP